MRIVLTGVDTEGRSRVVSSDAVVPESVSSTIKLATMYSTAANPPPPPPPGRATAIDLGVAPGLARWQVVDYEPGAAVDVHHTDSIDFDVVLEGGIEVILDDGPHRLDVGDCIVITGVDHGWKAGPDGCRLLVLVMGTSPPD